MIIPSNDLYYELRGKLIYINNILRSWSSSFYDEVVGPVAASNYFSLRSMVTDRG